MGGRLDSKGVYRTSDNSASKLSSKRHKVEGLIDTGSTKSLIGLRTTRHFAKAAGHNLELTLSIRSFRFGVNSHSALRSC